MFQSPVAPGDSVTMMASSPLTGNTTRPRQTLVDILNYHVAPVTIVKGAKATNMEKGPSKMWFVPGEHAEVYNLEGGFQGLTAGH